MYKFKKYFDKVIFMQFYDWPAGIIGCRLINGYPPLCSFLAVMVFLEFLFWPFLAEQLRQEQKKELAWLGRSVCILYL